MYPKAEIYEGNPHLTIQNEGDTYNYAQRQNHGKAKCGSGTWKVSLKLLNCFKEFIS